MKSFYFLVWVSLINVMNLYSQNTHHLKSFKNDFVGTWEGALVIYKDGQNIDSVSMAIGCHPVDSLNGFDWTIRYNTSKIIDERRYFLKIIDIDKGHFVMDERNGIYIDTYYAGGTLISAFDVMGNMIHTHTYRIGEILVFELTFHPLDAPISSGGSEDNPGQEIPVVNAYPMSTYQRAFLYKVN